MPVGRIILKSISESKKISDLKTDGARLLYTWLITHLDVNGCFSGDPQVIKGKVFTRLDKTNKIVEEYLKDLEQVKLILRYQVNGDIFLNVPDFIDKQPSLNPDREGKTNIPLPTPDLIQTLSRVTPPQVKLSKDKISKEKHLDHVLLTIEEHKKLIEKFGDVKTKKVIDDLDYYIENNPTKGNKYKSHYRTILKWNEKDTQDKTKHDKIAGIKAYKDFVPDQPLTPEQIEESGKARVKVSKILKDKHIIG